MDPRPSTTTTTTSCNSTTEEAVYEMEIETPATAPSTTKSLMGPPEQPLQTNNSSDVKHKKHQSQNVEIPIPYTIPEWSHPPSHPFQLEVLKDGSIIDNLDVTHKGAYMFGRIHLCDFLLEHPTISRFHAVLQFKGNKGAYIYDLGSTHGTFINKKQLNDKVYVELYVGDVIRFGQSSRLYIFQGPPELKLPETDLTSRSYAKDREASLRRARENAALADGISWGMGEDAIEEAEDDSDEITWQNYKGELTDKQQKTREKVLKRMEKIAHMKKEISAIRAKDVAQGGLTQGQQTQIARNDMRISQILEELESLEETLNDSIRESIGARAGKSSRGKQRGATEDEDELLSDDDEFYDRTVKKKTANNAQQSIETADSLLDKIEAVKNEMEEKRKLLEEKNKMPESEVKQDAGDALDAFMSGLSSQLVLDKTLLLEKDLSSLQRELDRIMYLLKIADPTGEATKKRQTAAQKPKSLEAASALSTVKKPEESKINLKKVKPAEKSASSSIIEQAVPVEETSKVTVNVDATDLAETKPTVYQEVKPQWLGAVEDGGRKESQLERQLDNDEGDKFVDYSNRKKIPDSNNSQPGVLESDLENAAPGLILRKKKHVNNAEANKDEPSNLSTSGPAGADVMAEDAVALLLKHKRGLYASNEDATFENRDDSSGQDNKRPKRVLGPEKPAFLNDCSDFEAWIPPEGQSGDGRTSLNDRLGY